MRVRPQVAGVEGGADLAAAEQLGQRLAAIAMFFTALRPSRTMARLIEPICPGRP
jgi:hypothetical protein